MKALSIRQPWAWAILHAGKRIENRERKDGRMPAICHHRGPLLIHAALGCTAREYTEAVAWMTRNIDFWGLPVPALKQLDRGGIVGVCNVVAHIDSLGNVRKTTGPGGMVAGIGDLAPTVPGTCEPEPATTPGGPTPSTIVRGLDRRWHRAGSYGLVLADVRPLPFIPYKGALGLFDVPGATPEMVVEIARREGRIRT